MKKFILDYTRYSQKFPRQLLRKMQQFILEEQLDLICDEDGRKFEEIVELEKRSRMLSEFKQKIANYGKNVKMKSDISLNTYEQYVEVFKLRVLAAGNAHRFSEKEIVKMFVRGLKTGSVSRGDLFPRIRDIIGCNSRDKTQVGKLLRY